MNELVEPFSGLPLTAAASEFVETSHAGRKYGQLRYTEHLFDVYLRVRDAIPCDHPRRDEACAAAWLHDDYEDTSTTRAEVRAAFGPLVDAVVFACTGGEQGSSVQKSRRFRNAAVRGKFLQLQEGGGAWWVGDGEDLRTVRELAQLVKVCDRISNVESCWRTRDARLFMYRDEHLTFRTLFQDAPGWVSRELARLDALLGIDVDRAKNRGGS